MEPITNTEYANLRSQVKNITRDTDRIRIIRAAALNKSFTTDQAIELVNFMRLGDALMEAACMIYESISDKKNFNKLIDQCFKYADEKAKIKDTLGL